MQIFPLIPWYSSNDESALSRFIKVYNDGTFRQYRCPGMVPVRYFSLYFEQMSTSDKELLQDFWDARMSPSDPDGGLFLVNDFSANPGGVLSPGGGGAQQYALTGTFLDNAITFSADGPCMWSLTTSHISGVDQTGSGSGLNILIVAQNPPV